MKLSEIKNILNSIDTISFILPDGTSIPSHFHVTEVGTVTKNFIDCGGTIRKEEKINFQLWTSTDYDHQLSSKKLAEIIELSEKKLNLMDSEIEVEFQQNTIGKYGLAFNGKEFLLTNTLTACLAEDACKIPTEKTKIELSKIPVNESSCCDPNSNCC